MEERQAYLAQLKAFDQDVDNTVRVFHDESTFHANADEIWCWAAESGVLIHPKSLGSAIKLMVSDLVTEDQWLEISNQEATANPDTPKSCRTLIELGANKDDYFNNEMLVAHTKKAVQEINTKYPGKKAVVIFDQAPSHKKKAANSLDTQRMNDGPGGKQPVMRAATWKGKPSPWCWKIALRSIRDMNVAGMKRDEMVNILSEHNDFKTQRTILQEPGDQEHFCLSAQSIIESSTQSNVVGAMPRSTHGGTAIIRLFACEPQCHKAWLL